MPSIGRRQSPAAALFCDGLYLGRSSRRGTRLSFHLDTVDLVYHPIQISSRPRRELDETGTWCRIHPAFSLFLPVWNLGNRRTVCFTIARLPLYEQYWLITAARALRGTRRYSDADLTHLPASRNRSQTASTWSASGENSNSKRTPPYCDKTINGLPTTTQNYVSRGTRPCHPSHTQRTLRHQMSIASSRQALSTMTLSTSIPSPRQRRHTACARRRPDEQSIPAPSTTTDRRGHTTRPSAWLATR